MSLSVLWAVRSGWKEVVNACGERAMESAKERQ